jgi:Zn-dependent metalloprotease
LGHKITCNTHYINRILNKADGYEQIIFGETLTKLISLLYKSIDIHVNK